MGRIYNHTDKLRHCLFDALRIMELYESRNDWQCHYLEWVEVELQSERWILSSCAKHTKTRKVVIEGRTFFLCQYTCRIRTKTPISRFFGKMSKRINDWKNSLVDDGLDRLEGRQHQRPIDTYIISM